MQRVQLIVAGAIALGSTLAVTAPALAQSKDGAKSDVIVKTEPGKAKMTGLVTARAKVIAIDAKERVLTLKAANGKEVQLPAGPEVKNFDQIKVGDDVVARYYESLSLELKKDGKALPSRTDSSDAARAKAGERPGAAQMRQVDVIADVTAVDAKTQTITLRGPQRTVDLKINDPEQFKLIKVGDQVAAKYTEAMALSVEPAKPAAKK
jgi:hypothetical protein